MQMTRFPRPKGGQPFLRKAGHAEEQPTRPGGLVLDLRVERTQIFRADSCRNPLSLK